MPDTRPGLKFHDGVCYACIHYEKQKETDWTKRWRELELICDKYRGSNGNSYDCAIAVSGGKDSHFQTHIIKDKLKMNPLLLSVGNFDWTETRMQKNLRIRAQVNSAIRNAMEKQGFVEIETPMLIASTPEGARDFVVPSRLHPANFYALPQSPQIFKQLCMVGGIDRYYQIARCLRDEDLRADRQFEFMQLDMEASFVTQEDVLSFVSEAIKDSAETITGERPGEIPTMTWHDAMERFGSDKPDTRFGMELIELSDIFQETEANVFKVDCVKGILYPQGAEMLGRNAIDALTEKCQSWGAKGLAWFKVGANSTLEGALTKFMSDKEIAQLVSSMGANLGDMVFVIADQRRTVNHILGLLRLELARPPVGEGGLNFLWITEFPLFESVTDSGEPIPAHHPFTMPHTDDLEMLDTASGEEYLSIRSQAYDLVLNGWELGSGSVRIHKKDIQAKIFSMLGIQDEEAEQKFGFLLDAFKYGAPPHAGFAFGIDRLVALLAGEENIREVIAFPKTQSGSDPLTNAPTPLDPAHLEELGLRLAPETT